MPKKIEKSGKRTTVSAKRSLSRMMETLAPYLPKPDMSPLEKPRDWSLPEIRFPSTDMRVRAAQSAPSGR